MVTALLLWRPGVSRKMHWPYMKSVDQLERRICAAFRQDWRRVRAVLCCAGRELFHFEKPWLWLPRRSHVEVDVRFERRSDEDAAELHWFPGETGIDDSDGYSTPSDISDAVAGLDGWGYSDAR